MKTLFLILALLTLSSLALADDNMAMGKIAPHSEGRVKLVLPPGKAEVSVWDEDHQNLTCSFVNSANGTIVSTQDNVPLCIAHSEISSAWKIVVFVRNGNDKPVQYRAQVKNVK